MNKQTHLALAWFLAGLLTSVKLPGLITWTWMVAGVLLAQVLLSRYRVIARWQHAR